MRALLTYGSYRLLGALVGPLPPRAGYWLARRTGPLIYALSPRLRNVLSHNIRHVLGPHADQDRVRALARQACVNIAKGHYDLFRVDRLNIEQITSLARIEGMERILSALRRGKGVVVVSAHFGNVDVMAQLPLAYGIPVTGAVEHIQPERLFRYLRKIRQRHGVRLIPTDEPLLGLFRALKRGEIVALPCDRINADNTRTVEFFGAPARLPDGPVRVALRTGAALIPAFCRRLADDSLQVRVEPEIELARTGDHEADVAAGMDQVVRAMERAIVQHPEQWLTAVPIWPMT